MMLHTRTPGQPRRGVILLAVLIVVVILSLAAYTYNDLILSEYRAADTYVRNNQARAAADSGIAYTVGMLCDPNAYANYLQYNPWNNPQVFQDVVVSNDDDPRKRTKFSIIALCSDQNDPFNVNAVATTYRFGVQDESAKLNLNSLMSVTTTDMVRLNILTSTGITTGLPNPLNTNNAMTSDIANYLLDWMDPNPTSIRSPTAKDSAYQGMQPPYHVKNGPFDSLEELLLVYTVTPQMVFGNDRTRSGRVLPADDDGYAANQGWSNYLTVYSREPNIDVNNNPRIWVNDPNLPQLYANIMNLNADGTASLAQFIVAYRLYGGNPPAVASNPPVTNGAGGAQTQPTTAPQPTPPPAMSSANLTAIQAQVNTDMANATNSTSNQITSLSALMSTTIMVPVQSGSGRSNNVSYTSPLADPSQQAQVLPLLFDELTTTNAADLIPRINVNTASAIALQMLPNLSSQEILNIQQYQPINPDSNPADPNYNTLAWLVMYAGLAPSKVQGIEPYVSARSRVYRFQSIGYSDSGTPVCRLEVVVDTSYGRPRIIYRRDISELGSGNFDFLPKPTK